MIITTIAHHQMVQVRDIPITYLRVGNKLDTRVFGFSSASKFSQPVVTCCMRLVHWVMGNGYTIHTTTSRYMYYRIGDCDELNEMYPYII